MNASGNGHRENLVCLCPVMGSVCFQASSHTFLKSDIHQGALRGCIIFWPYPLAWGLFVPCPGVAPVPPAVGAWSPNHLTTRDVLGMYVELFCTSFRNIDHGFWQLLKVPFGNSVAREGVRTMAVKSVASGRVGELPDAFRDLCNTSEAPGEHADTACAPQACVTGCVLSLARVWHSGWRLGLKRLEMLFGEYYGFSLLGIFMSCFEKTGVKKSCVSLLGRVRLFATPWAVPAKLLCAWALPGKNAGVSCRFLL